MPTVTQTQLKLSDAASQMLLAHKNSTVEPTFRSCINSFISAARSVTFVMQAESADHPALTEWYRARMEELKGNPLMRFFNEKRTHSIHRGVVSPTSRTFRMENYAAAVNDVPGRGPVKQISFSIKSTERPCSPGDVVTTTASGEAIIWCFDDVDQYLSGDSGNVYRLCENYFVILKDLVRNWLNRRRDLGLPA